MRDHLQRAVALLLFIFLAAACTTGGTPVPTRTVAVFTPVSTLVGGGVAPAGAAPAGNGQPHLITATPGTNVQPVASAPTIAVNPPAANVAASGSGGTTGTTGTCTPPNGWLAYTVQQGDTVSSLATLKGITPQDVITGNCLPNADVIVVGQAIYLPSTGTGTSGNAVAPVAPANTIVVTAVVVAPVVATPAPRVVASTGPAIARIWAGPALVQPSGQFQVAVGTTVTLGAEGVTNATKVTFYMAPIGVAGGSTPAPVEIGTDSNLTDGVVVMWPVTTANLRANLWAVATNSANENTQTAPIVVFTGPAS